MPCDISTFYEENKELHHIPKGYIQRYIDTTKTFCSKEYLCYINNSTVHIYVYKAFQGKWYPRKLIYDVGVFWFSNNDVLFTTVAFDNHKAQKFVEGVGFVKFGLDKGVIKYCLLKKDFTDVWSKKKI